VIIYTAAAAETVNPVRERKLPIAFMAAQPLASLRFLRYLLNDTPSSESDINSIGGGMCTLLANPMIPFESFI
jgi:hypothetical protein